MAICMLAASRLLFGQGPAGWQQACRSVHTPGRTLPAPAEAVGRAWRGSNSSRWNPGKELSFVPLRPERVVEVRYDHLEGRRFRHTAQFVRWRPDRDPRSCTYAQLEETVSFDLAEVLATPAT
jgi:hypothetical protein